MKNASVGTNLSRPARVTIAERGRDKSVPTILIGAILLVAALWSYMAFTAATHETLDQHVQRLGSQLKCPVCQGESVADSTSDRALEMRAIIRQQIQAGQSDQQIIQYFSDRYGDQIVWSPPWWGFSLLAWLVPIALLMGGLVLIFYTLRDWRLSAVTAGAKPAVRVAVVKNVNSGEDAEIVDIDEEELARYRAQLQRELAEEDVLFERPLQDEEVQ